MKPGLKGYNIGSGCRLDKFFVTLLKLSLSACVENIWWATSVLF